MLLGQPARGGGRRADPQTGSDEWGALVERDGVLVDDDPGGIQPLLGFFAGEVLVPDIHQHQVDIGTARYDAVAAGGEASRQRLGVGDNLCRVELESIAERLTEAHCLGGDQVLERPSLDSRKHRAIEILGVLLLAQDHPTAWPAQRLVRRGRDEVRHRTGIRMQPGCDQTRGMGDVGVHDGAHLVADLAHAPEVDMARVGRKADHDELRPVLAGDLGHRVVVEQLGLAVHTVGDDVVQLAGKRQPMAVRQMPTVGQIHPHDRVAGLQGGEVHAHVGLRAAVRLYIGMIGAEQRFGSLDRQVLGPIHELTAAVVPLAWVALGVFV